MNVAIVGLPKSGKTSVGIALAVLIAAIRDRNDRPSRRKQALNYTQNVLGIATEPTSASVFAEWSQVYKVAAATFGGIKTHLEAWGGDGWGVAILDTATRPYEAALKAWRRQSNAYRVRLGLTPEQHLGPNVWSVINDLSRDTTTRPALVNRLDLVEVHRQGTGFLLHPDYGLAEKDGVQARGAAEAGSPAQIMLHCGGGMKSRGPSEKRWLTVVSDATGLSAGDGRALPEFRRGGGSQADLLSILRDLLGGSVRRLMETSDGDRDLWEGLLDCEDDFPEARQFAERSETDALVATVKLLLLRHNLDGQGAEERRVRTESLLQIYGQASLEMLSQVPIDRLREGIASLDARLTSEAAGIREKSSLIATFKRELANRGLDGKKAEQVRTRERVLDGMFAVLTSADLESCDLRTLRKGEGGRFGEVLESLGYKRIEPTED